MNNDINFPQLPAIRPIPYPDRPAWDPANHQHDTVYSRNFGELILARTIGEDQWNSGMDNIYPEGFRMLVGRDDRGNHLIRYILINTETEDEPRTFRRVTYVYRPGERGPDYHVDGTRHHEEPIRSIPNNARLVTRPVDIAITVERDASSRIQIENSWQHATTLM
jgi:hypothetical protein